MKLLNIEATKIVAMTDYYERGSSLMDVLEAEDLGGGMAASKIDKVAAEKNKKIWACQPCIKIKNPL